MHIEKRYYHWVNDLHFEATRPVPMEEFVAALRGTVEGLGIVPRSVEFVEGGYPEQAKTFKPITGVGPQSVDSLLFLATRPVVEDEFLNAVRNALVGLGVPPHSVEIMAGGYEEPELGRPREIDDPAPGLAQP